MSLQRTQRFILGNQSTRATLAATYTAGNTSSAEQVSNAVKIFLEIEYTMGATEAANSIEVRVRFADPVNSPAATEWYQDSAEATGTVTLLERTFAAVSAAGTYDRFIIEVPYGHKYVDVAIKETGKATNFGNASVKLVTVEQESIN